MLGHEVHRLKGWWCHFLEGYKGLIQNLLGLHRRLSMEYHDLLARHFSEDMFIFFCLSIIFKGD